MRRYGWCLLFLVSVLHAEPPVDSVAKSTAVAVLPGVSAPLPPGMNQLVGSILSVDMDNRVIRVTVEGGFNVEFTYQSKTSVLDNGQPLDVADLAYGDQVIVRYMGRELKVFQINRTSRAPRAIPAQAPEIPESDASSVLSSSEPAAPSSNPN